MSNIYLHRAAEIEVWNLDGSLRGRAQFQTASMSSFEMLPMAAYGPLVYAYFDGQIYQLSVQ